MRNVGVLRGHTRMSYKLSYAWGEDTMDSCTRNTVVKSAKSARRLESIDFFKGCILMSSASGQSQNRFQQRANLLE